MKRHLALFATLPLFALFLGLTTLDAQDKKADAPAKE